MILHENLDSKFRKINHYILINLIFWVVILRFLNVEADFPSQVKIGGGAVYSDEGWWTNAAVRKIVLNDWYLDGDYNPAIKLPIPYILQYLNFKIFGIGFKSARRLVVFLSLLSFILIYKISVGIIGRTPSLLLFLFLIANPILFAYSRIALLEIYMLFFIVLNIYIADRFNFKNEFCFAILIAFLSFLSVLVKTTAIFIIPVIIMILWNKYDKSKNRYEAILIYIFIFSLFYFGYNYFVKFQFPVDYEIFTNDNLHNKIQLEPLLILKELGITCLNVFFYTKEFLVPTVVLIIILVIKKSDFYKNRLVQISFSWIVSNILLLSLVSQHPARYFVSFLIPIIILFNVTFLSFFKLIKNKVLFFILISYFIGVIFINLILILNFSVISPRFTFINMCRDLFFEISKYKDDNAEVLIIGDFVDTISLETGLISINVSHLHKDQNLSYRINIHKPKFYISIDIPDLFNPEILSVYDFYDLKSWTVYDYNPGISSNVTLYKLIPKL